MFDLIELIWRELRVAKWIEIVGLLSAFLSLGAILGFLFGRLGFRSMAKKLETTHEHAADLQKDLKLAKEATLQAERERDSLSPVQWLSEANKERKQGNEEHAIQIVEDGIARIRPAAGHSRRQCRRYKLAVSVTHCKGTHCVARGR